jgi:uncharacterized membrane protein YidH (DUF202 family)
MTRPGLAQERTAIAWGRTGLGAAGLGVVLLRLGIERTSPVEIAGGIVALFLSSALAVRGRIAYRSPEKDSSLIAHRGMTLALVTIGVLALVGAVS